ncbi:hypothetical protein SI65_07311 [Aspergillus cristatus]|uniref:Uncharacterized protein n=1 Tax=Aspergillus cristatus TaxID=573508 RepID=A0A1E3BB58_ASPCR|nr:hypothetical protein SI65_07311 [Aspergillus cristatus]
MNDSASQASSPAGTDEIDSERNREWHLQAAELAEESGKKYEAAADARKHFRLGFIGYLQLEEYREHIAAEKTLNEKAKETYLAAQEHKDEVARMYNSFSN